MLMSSSFCGKLVATARDERGGTSLGELFFLWSGSRNRRFPFLKPSHPRVADDGEMQSTY